MEETTNWMKHSAEITATFLCALPLEPAETRPRANFFWFESYFSKIQSAKLNTDETILMAGTEYFGQTAVQPQVAQALW